MKTTEIQAAVVALLYNFEPISNQPTDKDLTRLHIASFSVIMPIPFDWELGKHSLMGLMLNDDEYKARHDGHVFPSYRKSPAIYNDTIADTALAGVWAKTEAIHQAKLEDWKIFDCAQRKLRNSILSCLNDTWIRELRDLITGYAHVL